MRSLFGNLKRKLNSDRTWGKSALSLLLAALMLFSTLSSVVFAESNRPETVTEAETWFDTSAVTEALLGEPPAADAIATDAIATDATDATDTEEPGTEAPETDAPAVEPTQVEWTVDIDGSEYAVISGVLPEDGSATVEPAAIPRGSETTFSAYDLTVYDGEGEVYAPEDSLAVELHSEKIAETLAEGNSVGVLEKNRYGYFTSAETVSVGGDSVKFMADDNSTYYLYANQLVKTLVASDGNTYRITVLYDGKAGFPEDAEIRAEEVSLDSEDYVTYLENAAATLGVELSSLTYNRLFDIAVVDGAGTEYQPNDSVRVTVELMESEAESVEDLRVVHFDDENVPTELDASTSGNAVTFETDGFSIFSFNDTSLASRVINAIFGDSKLYENDDIILTGRMPLLGTVEATPVSVQVDGRDALIAYDIKIYANSIMKLLGIPWQPSEGAVQVTVKSDVFADADGVLSVYHMQDEQSEPEFVASVDAVDSAVTFDAESFSIYPIIPGPGPNARIGYRFWYYNGTTGEYEEITTQYFRYSDVHEQGSRLYEPSIPGIVDSELTQVFEGWHKGTVENGNVAMQDPVVTLPQLNDELENLPETEFIEGTIIDIIAKLKTAYYITYVDVNPNSVLSTDLVIKAAEGPTSFIVKSNVKPTKYEEDFLGWKKLEDLADPDAQLYEEGLSYEIAENITLAPVITGGYWLVYDDNDLVDDGTGNMVSGGASYTPSAFYMNSSTQQDNVKRPPDPEWTGYSFGGWYEDEGCTIPFVFGTDEAPVYLDKNTTLYAKWTPSSSKYTVIIWKQPTDPNATQYDFDQSFIIDTGVTTGQLVYLDSSYTNIYGANGTSSDLDKQYFTYNQEKTDQYIIVKANGSSVMNVYYDRVLMTMNFYTWGYGYTYTVTTSDTGTQYGIVNGQYVQLTREEGSEDVYSYAFSPRYTATTGNTGDQYGIIAGANGYGEYQLLERRASYTFNYNAYNPTSSNDGIQYALVNGEYVQLTRTAVSDYYALTSTLTAGNDYLIVSSDSAGTRYALANTNQNGAAVSVVVNPATGSVTTPYIDVAGVASSSVWTVASSGTGFTFQNGTAYMRRRDSNNNLRIDTTNSNRTWTWDGANNRLRNGNYYLRFNNNTFSLSTQVSSIYLYRRMTQYTWTYTDSNGNTVTLPDSATRYTRSGTTTTYNGIRYTRTGSNWWDYQYTETDEEAIGLYGVDDRGGHVALNRSNNVSGYSYYYNDVLYTGTRYYVPNNNPISYSGTLFTLDNGVYHVTSVDSNTEARYGQDDNGVFRELNATVTHPQLWTYNGEPYTGTRYTRSNNQSNSWQLYKSFVGPYGATLEQYGYEWPMEYWWYSNGGNGGSTSGTRTTLKTTFEPLDGNLNATFYGRNPETSGSQIIFYKQQLDGTYIVADTIVSAASSFHINDKYAGFHAAQYRTSANGNWNNVQPKGSDGYYGSSVSFNSRLEIRFDRNYYNLVFFPDEGVEPIEYSLPYETPISSYANQSEGQKPGHYFLGWFADDAHTTPFDFNTTMPDHPVSVYGYWRMERYRIVFVPGADNVYIDPGQAMTFRIDYDERVNGAMLEAATRTGYVLDGWYTDPNFTNKFLFSTPINSNTEGMDMTYHTAPRWTAARVSYGDDDEDHANVRGIIVLYAKWIINTSVKGVNVIYDAGEAAIYDAMHNLQTSVPVDPRIYQNGSDVRVGVAPSNYSELYVFDYWEAVDEDGNPVEIPGIGTALNPGTMFNVDDVPAFSETTDPETGEVILKTIKLRAKYTLSEEAAARYTKITYDGDTLEDTIYPSGTATLHGKTRDGSDLLSVTYDKEINSTIILPSEADFYLDGYTLAGWSFFEGTYDEQVALTNEWNTEHPDNQIWIFVPAQEVAADNLDQNVINDRTNTLYAMWQPKTYTVTVRQVVEDGVAALHNNNETFTYTYKSGVENALPSATSSLTLTGDDDVLYTNLTADPTVKYQYYGRVGHVFNIQPPDIPTNAEYAVRVNAYVLRDDGTREALSVNDLGNFEILGDVEIIFTYALKVPVILEKRSLSDESLLTGAKFLLTPVQLNAETHRWDVIGTDTFVYDMSSVSSLNQRLQEGYYRVEETQAPSDYAMMGEALILQVRKNEVFTIRTETGTSVSENIAKLTGSDSHTLTIYDRPIRTVTIAKVVQGDDFEPNGYTFSVQLSLEGSLMKNYDTVGNGNAADTTNSNGIIEFKLRNGEEKELKIPWGAVITVTENTYNQYDLQTIVSGATDADGDDTDRYVSFTVDVNARVTYRNIKKIPAPTGVALRFAPFVIMDLVGLALFALVWTGRKKRRGGDSV